MSIILPIMDVGKMAIKADAEIRKLRDQKLGYEKKIAEIDQRIDAFESILAGLRFLGNPEVELPLPRRMNLDGLGMQEAILKILRRSPVPLSPIEIREIMMNSGLVGTSPKNLLISIHTALRQRIQDRVEEVAGPSGRQYRLRETEVGKDTRTQPKHTTLDKAIVLHELGKKK